MKASKLIVLVGGVLGIIAFFLPLVAINRPDFHGTASAFQVVKGIDAGAVRTFIYAVFTPALVFAIVGGLALRRGAFGRGAGTLALVFGLLGLAVTALLKSAAEGDAGIGLTLLLVGCLAGTVGGILGIAKPERAGMLAAG
jgi:hypothetical protein